MSVIANLLVFGEYSFLVIPSLALVLGAWLVGAGEREGEVRHRLLLLLVVAALALASLDLLIWTNPYGREISSSIPAFGVLPVLVALIVLLLRKAQAIARLWSTDKAILSGLALVFVILFAWLWLAERTTFYLVVLLSAGLAVIWLAGTRSGPALLAILSLAGLGYLIYAVGGVFPLPPMENLAWLRTALRVAAGILQLLAIFMAAGVLYARLRGDSPLDERRFAAGLPLVAILVGSSAYPVFWDGIWSAAHARGFEDHLPFMHFLLSMMAGGLLALSLRGWRRFAGPAFVFLVAVVATLALIWGWNVSAFELTSRRADRIDAAIAQFYQDNARYPADLAELTPRYLLYLSPAVVVRQGDWCYQGGAGYYRLGYVSGTFTYFDQDFHAEIHAQAGDLPQATWNCDQLVADFEAGVLNY
jgi:hypothetical protein